MNKIGQGDEFIIEMLKKALKHRYFLIINKIDLVHPDELLEIIDSYKDRI